jgi:sugar lactone lactonase YvrE
MRKLTWIAFLLASTNLRSAEQYVISTIAGGVPLPTPAAASKTSLPNPGALATDSSGNLYVNSDNTLFQISTTGTITRIAGNGRAGFAGDGGLATLAQLDRISGIAIDPVGNIFISDAATSRIRKISASDGTIRTIAGTGTAGYSGDGAAATAAQLNNPTALAVDKAGNLYVADTGNHRVRQVNIGGMITTVAGNGFARYSGDNYLATFASLNAPGGLAIDSAGYLYIADSKNYVVRKIGFGGVITTIAGNGQKQTGGLDLKPNTLANTVPIGSAGAMCFGPSGELYIADPDNDAVWRVKTTFITLAAKIATFGLAVDAAGNLYYENSYWNGTEVAWANVLKLPPNATEPTSVTTLYPWDHIIYGDGGPATAARLRPAAMAFHPSGTVYIADALNGVVRTIDADGIIETFDPLGGIRVAAYSLSGEITLSSVSGLVFDATDNLFVADFYKVRKVTPKGVVTDFASVQNAGRVPGIGTVNALAADPLGNLYASGPVQIRRLMPDGVSNVVAGLARSGLGPDNVGANTSALCAPMQIAVDGYDSFYFADSCNNRVRRVRGALVTTVAGTGTKGFKGDNGPATSAELNTPKGVALDSAGNLYIADTGNHRIRKVATDGTITTVAGDGVPAYLGDGGPAINAELNLPATLEFDKAGNLYVADVGNNALRVILISQPLALATALLPGGTTGRAYAATLPASGGVIPYRWSVDAGTLPPGLALTPGGRITGTPSAPGTYSFTVAVRDAASGTVAQSYAIKVVAPLVLNLPAPLSQAIRGTPYSQTLGISGGTPPYVWSVVSGSLPAGLVLSTTGTITGIPTESGVRSCSVAVTDGANVMAAQGITINVVNPAPSITTEPDLPPAVTGMRYSQVLTAVIFNDLFSWSVSSGSVLPPGLQLAAEGLLSGTPTLAGAFTFTLTITDGAGVKTSQDFRVTIIDATALARKAVLPHIHSANGSLIELGITNSTTNPIGILLQLHADDGSTASTAFVLPPDATSVAPAPISGWSDVLATGALAVTARYESQTIALPSQFGPEIEAAYDNTDGSSTAVVLVNLSAAAATIVTESGSISVPGYGQTTVAVPAGKGTAKFQNPAGNAITGLILQTASDGTLTILSVTVPGVL